ncbi:MAG: DUF2442 domain-containing protein [Leptolyngbyaceae cyanobacterium]
MLRDIVAVQPKDNCTLHIVFEDDVRGDLQISELIEFSGIFAPLQEPEFFAKVKVHPELGTVYWPNDADLDPDVLYSHLSCGEPQLDVAKTIS